MKVYNRSGFEVANISITLTDDGVRYSVVDRYYEYKRTARQYKTLEKAIEMTQRRHK